MQYAAATATRGSYHRVHRLTLVVLVMFLLIFPKGGIKLLGVPVTWGYVALGLFFATVLPLALLDGRLRYVRQSRLLVIAAILPFQLVSLLAFAVNGVSGLGFTLSFLITFFFLPAVFVLLMGPYLDRLDADLLFRLIRIGVLAVACYGIVLFFIRLLTGRFLEIPLLTVNVGDFGGLEDKYIDRGGIFKLISTYNNGNIYGISMLMILPLYQWLERSRWRTGIVKLSLLLTLSRTVWIGLILYEILAQLYIRRITWRSVVSLSVVLGMVALAIGLVMEWLGVGMAFLLDRQLGGRAVQLEYLRDAAFFPAIPFSALFEMVYVAILHNFGFLGLGCFLFAMTMPLMLYSTGRLPLGRTEFARCIVVGLTVYLVIAASDGAILYIPVMAFYWFLVSLLLSSNPAFALRGQRTQAGAATR